VSDPIKLSSPATKELWEIPVLFEDDHLLAISKPPGLLTSADRYDVERPNLMKLLHTGIAEGKHWAKTRGLSYLANAHRLDFDTSGVILLAKTKSTLVTLANLFGTEKPVSIYVAILPGTPPDPQWEVDAPLAPFPGRPGQVRVDTKNGKRSRTSFEVREQFRGYTLVQCRPYTARTHQIRVHLKHWGLPICGDRVYGGRPLFLSELKDDYRLKPSKTERPLIQTVALHAEQLTLPHPVTGAELKITAPWSKDFTVAIKNLRRHAPPPGRDLPPFTPEQAVPTPPDGY
jgi:RluA family pseudouridine synthase